MMVHCELCDWSGTTILEHISIVHPDANEELVRWPDGDIVVFDEEPRIQDLDEV